MEEERWLAQLRDRLEIEDLLTRYCAAIDAKDFDLLDEVFTADATIDYTRSGGIRDEFPAVKSWLAKALAPFRVVQHLITNVRLEIDGDRARSVCYFFNPRGLPQQDGSARSPVGYGNRTSGREATELITSEAPVPQRGKGWLAAQVETGQLRKLNRARKQG